MHDNFESLKARCRRYHNRRRTAIALKSVSALALVVVVIWAVLFSGIMDPQSTAVAHNDIPAPKVEVATEQESVAVVSAPPKSPQKPHQDVAYNVLVDENYLVAYSKKTAETTPQKKATDVATKPVQKFTTKSLHVAHKPSQNEVQINTRKMDSIKAMQEQYDKEPNYELALKIAQMYYDKGNYTKASLWSKKANMMDKMSDKAWIMYAKSEYARGHQDRAKEILQLYLANKNSEDAEVLLMTWREGE